MAVIRPLELVTAGDIPERAGASASFVSPSQQLNRHTGLAQCADKQ